MNKEFESDNPPNYDGQSNTTYTFEATEDDWIVVGDALWEKGIPGGDDLNQVISGTNVYATNLSGNYPENSNSSSDLSVDVQTITCFENNEALFTTSFNIVEFPNGKSTFPGNLVDDILACIIEIISFIFSIAI